MDAFDQPSRRSSASIGHSVIPLVNKLQDIFARIGHVSTIDLPQVAVVGSQSSGKSSVLEALVGRDFLPRGADICTRRPLVLQLVQTAKDTPEWGEFLHAPGRRFTEFSLIRAEIEEETKRELGSGKGVSDKQIRLKIFSPNVLDITLVDLPGITKVPVGDQPSDIELRVRTMILSYIKHESCIILAVSPANADLANSDALQMARIVDPDGSRTIGVITKLDIMDRGTDARGFLLGHVIPLRLGYVGIVNRSQEDITEKRSIQDALAQEENFFRSHPVYHSLADRCGIPQLAKKLNNILVQHIGNILPSVKARINTQMISVSKELDSYGETADSKSDRGALILDIVGRYSEVFTSIIDGKGDQLSMTEVFGGARINYIFQDIFVKRLNEVDPCDDITDDDIQTAIQNTRGPKTIIFVPEEPFEVLVRRQISRLLHPSLQCAHFVYDELVKISHRCEPSELQRYPILRKRMVEVMGNFLREGLQPAERMIYLLIEMEMDHINTSNPHFVGGSKALEIALQHHRATKSFVEIKELSTPGTGGSDKTAKTRSIFAKSARSSVIADNGIRQASVNLEGSMTAGSTSSTSWGMSYFGETRLNGDKDYNESLKNLESSISTIQLKEPPAVLKASDVPTEAEAIEIAVTRALIKSYYDVVRKKIQDMVPKAIMHFLVNHTKRGLQNTFIRKLYREPLFEELLQEREEVAARRNQCKEILQVLKEAAHTLEDLYI